MGIYGLLEKELANAMSLDHSGRTREPSDAELLVAMADKKQWALAALYDRYAKVLYGLTMKILNDPATAQDVVHDAFLITWHKAAMYDQKRGSACPWLVVLCRNLAIDCYRLRRMNMTRRCVKMESAETWLAVSVANPESDAIAAEERRLLGAALEKLPAEQKQVIEMAYFNGMCQREIAEAVDAPLGTIKTRTRLAIRKLRMRLKNALEFR